MNEYAAPHRAGCLLLGGRGRREANAYTRGDTFAGSLAKQRRRKRKRDEREDEERVSGWFIESLSPGAVGFARRKVQAEGRLYSFQAQKLNLISNINLFSLSFSFSYTCFRSLFLFSLRSFPSICRYAPASFLLPIRVAARLHYTRPATNNVFRFSH